MAFVLAAAACLAIVALYLSFFSAKKQHCPRCGAIIRASRGQPWVDDWQCAKCGASWKDEA